METFLHKLEKFDPGIVWLDKQNIVVAMNNLAKNILQYDGGKIIGQEILKLHPKKSREKIKWILQSVKCPLKNPPPMTMMINVPDKILLIKVSQMINSADYYGTCMIFFDLTDIVTQPSDNDAINLKRLSKLPVLDNKKITLIDLDKVVFIEANGHYSTVSIFKQVYLCHTSLSGLEDRLDPDIFIKVHRRYIINIKFAKAFEKTDSGYLLTLKDEQQSKVPIGRSKIKVLKYLLGI